METSSLWHGGSSQESQDLYDRIVELRPQGLGYRKCAAVLNAEGLKTPRGEVFTSAHVHGLIRKRRLRDERLNADPKVTYRNSGLYFLERKYIKKWDESGEG